MSEYTTTRPEAFGHQSRRLVNRRILVVDDETDAADTMALLLRLQGHEARAVYDGEATLDAVEEFCPEIILLDIGLPKLDGYEVVRRLRSRPGAEKIVIIAITGLSQAKDRRLSSEAGFNHHLVKPVSRENLNRIFAGLPSQADSALGSRPDAVLANSGLPRSPDPAPTAEKTSGGLNPSSVKSGPPPRPEQG